MIQSIKSETHDELILGDIPVPVEVKIAGEYGEKVASEPEARRYPKVHLFFSFDIVNSTLYKTITGNWPTIIKNLLEDVRARVYRVDTLQLSYLWRIIGDEIVFVLPINSEKDLVSAVEGIFEVTQRLCISLKTGKFFDTIDDQRLTAKEIHILKSQNMLSIKATAWIAVVNETMNTPFDNIEFDYSSSSRNQSIREFLGKDIDAGFRLKSYTQDRRLCISMELAHFLSQNGQSDKLHIMDYVRLKGVWNDNLYPIIWYHNVALVESCQREMTDQDLETGFEESFRYDEASSNEMVSKYVSRKTSSGEQYPSSEGVILPAIMYETEKALPKIIKDRNLQSRIKHFKDSFVEDLFVHTHEPYEHPLELHCAVICCDVEKKKILIAQRSDNRKRDSRKWEFGCAKMHSSKSIIETIKETYQKEFGMAIEVVCDTTRKDIQPLPFAIYEIAKTSENKVKGVVFVARVLDPIEEKQFRPEGRHMQIKWVDRAAAQCIAEEDAVNDFHNTINTVFEKFHILFPEVTK